jgi:hypothetical protein
MENANLGVVGVVVHHVLERIAKGQNVSKVIDVIDIIILNCLILILIRLVLPAKPSRRYGNNFIIRFYIHTLFLDIIYFENVIDTFK